jgi:hypothetical protein
MANSNPRSHVNAQRDPCSLKEWRALRDVTTASNNTGLGAGALTKNTADSNTAVGSLALFNNFKGTRNTAVGASALTSNAPQGTGTMGKFNGAVGAFSLFSNMTGFSNNAFGDSALFRNISGAQNTAIGDEALENNDATNSGASFNTAVGALALFNNVTGVGNTAVGQGVGPNLAAGFNNTYIGSLVGTNADDEDLTIRIGDVSADGFGSAACFIGGIFNNPQPPNGDNVVVVTLDLNDDHLGYDPGAGVSAPVQRGAPAPRSAPGAPAERPAMLNGKVGKVEKLEAKVAQQQKQIETLTAQLREQAAQIQKVSAQVEMIKPAPRVVENR